MKEMIKKNRGALFCSALVMLAGILVGFTDTYRAWMWINGVFVVTHGVVLATIFYDNRNRQQSGKVIGMIIWLVPLMTILYNGIARLIFMEAATEDLVMTGTYYGIGLLFVVIGNYLPKVKQNNTIGIRVVWALQDEDNWNATHRFSGKLWMAAGILCMLCGLFGESMDALVLYIGSMMAAAGGSILYSYLFYKKKIQTGEKAKIQYQRRSIVGYTVFGILVIGFTAVTLFWGKIEICFDESGFTIEAQGWSNYRVDDKEIDSISYEENIFQGMKDYRINGFGNLKYGMGNFRNDVYGDYIRYTHSSCHSYVVLDVEGKTVVLNGTDDAETKEIYDTIRARIGNKET